MAQKKVNDDPIATETDDGSLSLNLGRKSVAKAERQNAHVVFQLIHVQA